MYFKFSHIKRSLDVGSFRHGAVFILSKSAVCFPHAHASLAPYGCRSSRNYLCTSMFQAQRRNGRIIPFLRKKKKKTRNIFLSIFQLTSQWAESSHTVNLSSRETKKVTLWPLPVSAVQTSKGEKLGMLRASQFQCLPCNRMPENRQTAGTIPALTKLTF